MSFRARAGTDKRGENAYYRNIARLVIVLRLKNLLVGSAIYAPRGLIEMCLERDGRFARARLVRSRCALLINSFVRSHGSNCFRQVNRRDSIDLPIVKRDTRFLRKRFRENEESRVKEKSDVR